MAKPYSIAQIILNWLIELGSVLIFWIAFRYSGMLHGIFWSLIATFAAVFLGIAIQKRIPFFPLVMSTVVIIFGGYSLISEDPTAFIVQHTIYYGLGGWLLIIGLFNGKSYLKPLFDNLFELTDRGWIILARRWSAVFLLLAFGNELVWRTMPQQAWANYKLAMTFTVTVFGLWQLRLARRERLPSASRWGLKIR